MNVICNGATQASSYSLYAKQTQLRGARRDVRLWAANYKLLLLGCVLLLLCTKAKRAWVFQNDYVAAYLRVNLQHACTPTELRKDALLITRIHIRL